MRDDALVHPRFPVPVGADGVVPPLVQDLVGDEVINVSAAHVRHLKYAVIDHDQRAAFVAIPGKEPFRNREVLVRIWPEPPGIGGDGFRRDPDHFLREERMLGQGQDAQRHAVDLADVLLEPVAGQQREIAKHARGRLVVRPTIG